MAWMGLLMEESMDKAAFELGLKVGKNFQKMRGLCFEREAEPVPD